ncbi:unnamed protein product, partial [Dibothriocephalus latus]
MFYWYLSPFRCRVEKERNDYKSEVDDLQGQVAQLSKLKMNSEKNIKTLESQVSEMSAKLDEANRSGADLGSQKARAAQEAADLQHQLEEAESQI